MTTPKGPLLFGSAIGVVLDVCLFFPQMVSYLFSLELLYAVSSVLFGLAKEYTVRQASSLFAVVKFHCRKARISYFYKLVTNFHHNVQVSPEDCAKRKSKFLHSFNDDISGEKKIMHAHTQIQLAHEHK